MKQLTRFKLRKEENPTLGVRAVNCPEAFRTRLCAIYRASAHEKEAIMFPMIASVWEVRACKWCGGKIQRVRPSVIHLMRGQVYNIRIGQSCCLFPHGVKPNPQDL